jgi:hypothetical protein
VLVISFQITLHAVHMEGTYLLKSERGLLKFYIRCSTALLGMDPKIARDLKGVCFNSHQVLKPELQHLKYTASPSLGWGTETPILWTIQVVH